MDTANTPARTHIEPPPDAPALGVQVQRLAAVMARLRVDCPWDAEQTHLSLTKHLVEETGEVLDAIETGNDEDLAEELGDVLLQICFHAEIARREGRFSLDDVADGIANKLISRHPYVFGDKDVPTDMMGSWEAAKQAEKQRGSALEGIPDALNSLARATKVVSRSRHVHVDVEMATEPITAQETGDAILAIVQRAQASGVDADQATRDAVRALEDQVRAAERPVR